MGINKIAIILVPRIGVMARPSIKIWDGTSENAVTFSKFEKKCFLISNQTEII